MREFIDFLSDVFLVSPSTFPQVTSLDKRDPRYGLALQNKENFKSLMGHGQSVGSIQKQQEKCTTALGMLGGMKKFSPDYTPQNMLISGLAEGVQDKEQFDAFIQTIVNDLSKSFTPSASDALVQYFHYFAKVLEAARVLTVEALQYHQLKARSLQLINDIDEMWVSLGRPKPSNAGKRMSFD